MLLFQDESANAFNFEMYGDAQGRYVAVAFGSEARMANADLYYCTATELFSGAITTQNQNPNVENSLPVSAVPQLFRVTFFSLILYRRCRLVFPIYVKGLSTFHFISLVYLLM